MKKELLEIKNLSKNYGSKEVLKDVSLTIKRGKIVGLLGTNGSGKSTLIKLINDLLIRNTGEILVNGEEIGVNSKKKIAYLPERTYLDKSLTPRQVLAYFKDFYSNFDDRKAIKLLEKLDLDMDLKLSKMSKGMQEKVQLVLVMSRKADLYILDEPLGGVDPATRDYILDIILDNLSNNASILISTHLIADIEKILDETIFIKAGKIVLADTKEHLMKTEKATIDEVFRRMFKC